MKPFLAFIVHLLIKLKLNAIFSSPLLLEHWPTLKQIWRDWQLSMWMTNKCYISLLNGDWNVSLHNLSHFSVDMDRQWYKFIVYHNYFKKEIFSENNLLMYYLIWWTIFLQIFIIGSLQNIGVQTVDLESLMFCNAVQLCFLNLAVDYICVSAACWLPSGRHSHALLTWTPAKRKLWT